MGFGYAAGCFFQHGVVAFFSPSWRYVSREFQKSAVVEPVGPFQGGEFKRFQASPRSTPTDHFSLVEAVDRFGGGIVIDVADTEGTSFCQLLGVPEGKISGGDYRFNGRSSLLLPDRRMLAFACGGHREISRRFAQNLIGRQNLAVIPLQSHHLLGHFAFA